MSLCHKLLRVSAGLFTRGGTASSLLQTPDSKPTLKQEQSLLNATERTDVGVDASMGFLTFMVIRSVQPVREAVVVCVQGSDDE
jgi:hypothetical protein